MTYTDFAKFNFFVLSTTKANGLNWFAEIIDGPNDTFGASVYATGSIPAKLVLTVPSTDTLAQAEALVTAAEQAHLDAASGSVGEVTS